MKIVCENCGAKYSIADEKIKGKIFKIRCKKCNESIVIRGDAQAEVAAAPEPANAAPPPMPAADAGADDGDAETRVFDYSGYQQGGAGAGGEAVWHIVVEGNQQGPYTTGQIKEYLAGGNLDWETFIWREGFDDWKPIRDVADFGAGGAAPRAQAAPAASPVAAAAPAVAAFGGGGLFDAPASGGGLFGAQASGGGLFDATASGGGLFDAPAAASPAAAGKAGGLFDAKPAGGLFGGSAPATSPGDVFSSAPSSDAGGDSGGLFGGGGGGGGGGGLFDGAEGGGDLFGESHDADAGGGGIFSSAGAGVPEAVNPRVSAAQAMMTGQRNENSVLFSLSNLQALASTTEAPAAKSGGGFSAGGEASGLIDIRSMASSMGGAERTGLDDLISIGGGGFAPSLGAPVLAAQHTGMSMGAKIGIIGGGVALLAAAVIVVVVLMQPEEPKAPVVDPQVEALKAQLAALMTKGGSAQDVADAQKQLEKAQQGQGESVTDTSGGEAATGGDKVADNGGKKTGGDSGSKPKKGGGGGASKDKGEPKDVAAGSGGSGGGSAGAAAGGSAGGTPKKGGVDELDDLLGGSGGGAAKKPPKEEPKSGGAVGGSGGGAAAGGGGGGSLPVKLTREQVMAGMNAVSGSVSKCGQGQTGTVTVQVTIAPTGRVTSATTTGSFAGTPAGLCAARAVRGARFPQSQSSTPVTYPFKF